jgi:hypothetical protein
MPTQLYKLSAFIRALVLFLFAILGCGAASATVCTDSFSQIQTLINQDIASGVPGGITATTVNSLMQVQNNCYLNVEDYPSAAIGALGITPNTTGGFATWPISVSATSVTAGALGPTVTINNSNWSGTALALSNIASQAANTVLGALTATNPSALALPSCSGASNALTWTTATGFGCNTITAAGVAFPATVSGTTTSGGIPYFSGTATLSTSGVLVSNAIMIGGGAGAEPSTTTTGSGVLTAISAAVDATGGIGTVGTSGATVGLLNGNNTTSGNNSHSGVETFAGSLKVATRTVSTATDTISATTDYFLCVTYTSTGAVTETLPAGVAGMTFQIKDCGGSAQTHAITITPAAGNIDGAGTYSITTNYGSVSVTYANSTWSVN